VTDSGRKRKPPPSRAHSKEGEKVRPSFYAEDELLRQIEQQAKLDKENKSSWLEKVISLLLESSNGKKLREAAAKDELSMIVELSLLLAAFFERLPMEEIEELAAETQRDRYQMVVFLARLGLQTYKNQQR